MDELRKQFQVRLEKRQFAELEDTWLALLERDLSRDELLRLCEDVVRHGHEEHALTLARLLADSLRDRGQPAEQMAVLRWLARYAPRDAELSRETAKCLHRLHPGWELLERLLHKSGLGYGTRLDRALESFDTYLALQPGAAVYDPDRGPGLVTNMDLLLDRITVKWQAGTENGYEIAAAGKRLRVSPADGFFTRLARDRDDLAAACRADPAAVTALFLRDVGHPVGIRDIQSAMEPLVPAPEWPAFWERARRGLQQHPHVGVLTSPSRTWRWLDEPAARPTELAREGSDVRRAVPEVERLQQMRMERLIEEYEHTSTATGRRQLLERIAAARPDDWDRVYATLFRTGKDNRARQTIEQELSAKRPDLWQKVLEESLTGYRQRPEAFVWLLENADRYSITNARGYVSRMLDLLESINHRSNWNALRRRLAADGYRLVLSTLEQCDQTEAGRLLERVHRCRGLEEFRKAELMDLFVNHFPGLAAPSGDEIWGTAAGIRRAESELQEMTEKQLPAVAEEIARARAHGDLSENYEYKAAKEKQARLMARVSRLREDLERSQVLTPEKVDLSRVSPGTRVTLTDEGGATTAYTILGPWESDPDHHIISHQSPLALALLGRQPGDRVEVDGRVLVIAGIDLGF